MRMNVKCLPIAQGKTLLSLRNIITAKNYVSIVTIRMMVLAFHSKHQFSIFATKHASSVSMWKLTSCSTLPALHCHAVISFRTDFLPLESKYHMTRVRHYLPLLLPNLLPLKFYRACLCCGQTARFFTWSIFEADNPDLSDVPLALCSSFLSSAGRSLSRYSAYWCLLWPRSHAVWICLFQMWNGIDAVVFSGFNRWRKAYY